MTVGVLIPDLRNPLFPPIVRGIEDRLAADGYVVLIGNTDLDADREQMLFERMRDRNVDGYILTTAQLRGSMLAEAAQSRLPVVLANRLAEGYSFPSVSVDNELGIKLVVGHLTELGHARIGYIAGPQDVSTGLGRYLGFVTSMETAGLSADPARTVFSRAFSVEEGYRCCRELLDSRPPCTAIAAGNDMLAIGCYTALEESGRSCPDDISVVGFNDMPFIDRLRPPLTTVAFPHYQLGTEAAELLLARMAVDGHAVKVLYLAPHLVVRGSTAAPAR